MSEDHHELQTVPLLLSPVCLDKMFFVWTLIYVEFMSGAAREGTSFEHGLSTMHHDLFCQGDVPGFHAAAQTPSR